MQERGTVRALALYLRTSYPLGSRVWQVVQVPHLISNERGGVAGTKRSRAWTKLDEARWPARLSPPQWSFPDAAIVDYLKLAGLNDSKMLSPAQRAAWCEIVVAVAVSVGVGMVEVEELDNLGLSAANRIAMERAVLALDPSPEVLLLDAAVIELTVPQVGIIDGDALCLSIAAASVIAKVTRDRIMIELDEVESRYGFAAHKGYGTVMHLAALREFGPSPIHRRCFAPVSALLAGE